VNDKHPNPKADARVGTGTPASKRETVTTNNTGRVTHDDRGNAVWEWAVSTGKFSSDAAAQRLKKLDNLSLSIAEDAPMAFDAVKKNPQGTVKGYSPYDSGLLEKKAAPRKKDLRKLSEWLKLKKQASSNKSED
jgi:hypothetical protein